MCLTQWFNKASNLFFTTYTMLQSKLTLNNPKAALGFTFTSA